MSDELINEPRPLLPRSRAARVVLAIVLVVGLVYAGHRLLGAEQHAPPLAARQPVPTVAHLTSGLLISGKRPMSTRVITDSSNASTFTLVVRADAGSLGRRSAVVTYPALNPAERPVWADTIAGRAPTSAIEVPLNGRRATVRGDLPRADLVRIGHALTVVSGRPALGDLSGYTATATEAYGGCDVLQANYWSANLGVAGTLGDGTVFVALTNCGSFEDSLFRAGVAPGPTVDGHATSVSAALDANATLSWEISPGLVGVVGYTGTVAGPRTVSVLAALAARTEAPGVTAWAATEPQPLSGDVIDR